MAKKKIGLDILLPAITAILPFLKAKKKFILWYQGLGDGKWIKKTAPLSKRQCRKTMNELLRIGNYVPDRFAILREGTMP